MLWEPLPQLQQKRCTKQLARYVPKLSCALMSSINMVCAIAGSHLVHVVPYTN